MNNVVRFPLTEAWMPASVYGGLTDEQLGRFFVHAGFDPERRIERIEDGEIFHFRQVKR